jgi:hypothetical protein
MGAQKLNYERFLQLDKCVDDFAYAVCGVVNEIGVAHLTRR